MINVKVITLLLIHKQAFCFFILHDGIWVTISLSQLIAVCSIIFLVNNGKDALTYHWASGIVRCRLSYHYTINNQNMWCAYVYLFLFYLICLIQIHKKNMKWIWYLDFKSKASDSYMSVILQFISVVFIFCYIALLYLGERSMTYNLYQFFVDQFIIRKA